MIDREAIAFERLVVVYAAAAAVQSCNLTLGTEKQSRNTEFFYSSTIKWD